MMLMAFFFLFHSSMNFMNSLLFSRSKLPPETYLALSQTSTEAALHRCFYKEVL